MTTGANNYAPAGAITTRTFRIFYIPRGGPTGNPLKSHARAEFYSGTAFAS